MSMTVAELNWKRPAGVLRVSTFGGSRTGKAPTGKAPAGKAPAGKAQQRVCPGYTSFRLDAKTHPRSRRRPCAPLWTHLAPEASAAASAWRAGNFRLTGEFTTPHTFLTRTEPSNAFFRSLKVERVSRHSVVSFAHARRELSARARWYSDRRPHQAWDYRSPHEFSPDEITQVA